MCIRRKNEYLKQMKTEQVAISGSSTLSVADLRGDWNTQKRLRLLQELRQNVEPMGWVSERWKEPLDAAFGDALYNILRQWHTTEGMHFLMTEMMIKKNEIYQLQERPPEEKIAAAAEKQARLEAPLRRAAVMKFIDMQEQSLISQASIQAASQSQHSDPLELYQRYETTARRNLHRAIREYMCVGRDLLSLRGWIDVRS